jgi:predicted transcriptional regulator
MDHARSLTVDLDEAELAELAALAEHEQRTANQLATDAVRARLARHRAYLEAIDRGLEDIAAGRTMSHEHFLQRRAEQRRCHLDQRQP